MGPVQSWPVAALNKFVDSTKRPRFHIHFTPTSASWLNLVERRFALLTQRQFRRGVHRSTKELKAAINDFIERECKVVGRGNLWR
jgi:hypothetical protein